MTIWLKTDAKPNTGSSSGKAIIAFNQQLETKPSLALPQARNLLISMGTRNWIEFMATRFSSRQFPSFIFCE